MSYSKEEIEEACTYYEDNPEEYKQCLIEYGYKKEEEQITAPIYREFKNEVCARNGWDSTKTSFCWIDSALYSIFGSKNLTSYFSSLLSYMYNNFTTGNVIDDMYIKNIALYINGYLFLIDNDNIDLKQDYVYNLIINIQNLIIRNPQFKSFFKYDLLKICDDSDIDPKFIANPPNSDVLYTNRDQSFFYLYDTKNWYYIHDINFDTKDMSISGLVTIMLKHSKDGTIKKYVGRGSVSIIYNVFNYFDTCYRKHMSYIFYDYKIPCLINIRNNIHSFITREIGKVRETISPLPKILLFHLNNNFDCRSSNPRYRPLINMGSYILQSISWGEGIHYTTKMFCKANSLDNKKVYYDVYYYNDNENAGRSIKDDYRTTYNQDALFLNTAGELVFIYMLKSELEGGGIKKYSRKKTIKKQSKTRYYSKKLKNKVSNRNT